ncbi:hypothetical protein Dsin_022839 [Dipteronia sinensis]|uniref:RNase H type-1 domain-containing protein n=1 Tax=Dipteronia sinensis TaxID=43782 RepID=A0AAE0A394_9ROSI|nr:hypothetical protein Dsin_022839 [Dipteronia sinensis]
MPILLCSLPLEIVTKQRMGLLDGHCLKTNMLLTASMPKTLFLGLPFFLVGFAIVWSIWEARNVVVFKGIPADVNYFTDLIKFRIAWWFKHYGKGWSPPAFDVLKFNVDGSVRSDPGRAGIGGVLRDSSGKVLCQFSIFLGYLDVEAAEIVAIQKAVNLCASKPSFSGRKIEVVSDSKAAVAWVNEAGFEPRMIMQTVSQKGVRLQMGNTSAGETSSFLAALCCAWGSSCFEEGFQMTARSHVPRSL